MPHHDDSDRLRHMLEAARKAIQFIDGRERTDLETDEQLALALVRLLEVIGEAAYRISSETRERHPGIEWKPIMAVRNRLIHGYADVDMGIVWNIIVDDLPPLISQLEKIIPSHLD